MADPEKDDPKIIECGEFDEEDKGEHAAHAFSEEDPVARFDARQKVEPETLAAIFAWVNKRRCPETKCPQMRLIIKIGPPKDAGATIAYQPPPGGVGAPIKGFNHTWMCAWTARIDCVRNKLPGFHPTTGTDGRIKEQALSCDDELVVVGVESAVSLKALEDEAKKEASDLARKQAEIAIQQGTLKVHCWKEDCQIRQITVLIGPPKVMTLLNYVVAGCPWGLKVECVNKE